ncbi:uncharacterized protein LOC134239630 [Saccostrea cucullata]|uniref:uncharacterized protein LOC134239630 n=1 Tax=Saccostrea cuccullata TaxID=36930 RepID=UPI002ED34F53
MAFTTCLFVLWICTITGAKEFQIGGTIKLPCNVPSTFTEFSWTKFATVLAKYTVSGSSFVSNDGRVDVITPEKAGKLGELTIKDITRHDSGNYTCTALVRNGPLKETSFTVTVVELTSTKSSTSGMTTSVKEIGN